MSYQVRLMKEVMPGQCTRRGSCCCRSSSTNSRKVRSGAALISASVNCGGPSRCIGDLVPPPLYRSGHSRTFYCQRGVNLKTHLECAHPRPLTPGRRISLHYSKSRGAFEVKCRGFPNGTIDFSRCLRSISKSLPYDPFLNGSYGEQCGHRTQRIDLEIDPIGSIFKIFF